MNARSFASLLSLFAACAAAACSGENPNELTGAPPPDGVANDSNATSPTPSATSTAPAAPAPTSTTTAPVGGPDAGPDSGSTPPKKSAFDGAPAYVATLGASTEKTAHSFGANTPKTNPAGKKCLDCHDATGGTTQFSAGGTVYSGTTPVAKAEVRIVGSDGKAFSTYTDADGNFFLRASTQFVSYPALVGVRDASGTRVMTALATKGNCNECHGAAMRIVVGP